MERRQRVRLLARLERKRSKESTGKGRQVAVAVVEIDPRAPVDRGRGREFAQPRVEREVRAHRKAVIGRKADMVALVKPLAEAGMGEAVGGEQGKVRCRRILRR